MPGGCTHPGERQRLDEHAGVSSGGRVWPPGVLGATPCQPFRPLRKDLAMNNNSVWASPCMTGCVDCIDKLLGYRTAEQPGGSLGQFDICPPLYGAASGERDGLLAKKRETNKGIKRVLAVCPGIGGRKVHPLPSFPMLTTGGQPDGVAIHLTHSSNQSSTVFHQQQCTNAQHRQSLPTPRPARRRVT